MADAPTLEALQEQPFPKEPETVQMLEQPALRVDVPSLPAAPASFAGKLFSSPFDWKVQAPRLTAALLAVLGVAEAARLAWTIGSLPAVPAPAGPLKARATAFHWWKLQNAHLFGEAPTPEQVQAEAVQAAHSIHWVLTGVIATKDPAGGIAIVGEEGRIQVLKAGSAFEAIPGSQLAEIYYDHVMVMLNGRLQRVDLPHLTGEGGVMAPPLAQFAAAPPPNESPPMQPLIPEPMMPIAPPAPVPTEAENLLGALNAQPRELRGKIAGMTLHPTPVLQRQFGLREGDVVTAINGVEVTDPGALSAAFRGPGQLLTVTYTRDGVEQTVNLPLNN